MFPDLSIMVVKNGEVELTRIVRMYNIPYTDQLKGNSMSSVVELKMSKKEKQ